MDLKTVMHNEICEILKEVSLCCSKELTMRLLATYAIDFSLPDEVLSKMKAIVRPLYSSDDEYIKAAVDHSNQLLQTLREKS